MTAVKPTNDTIVQLVREILERLDTIEKAQDRLTAEVAKIVAHGG